MFISARPHSFFASYIKPVLTISALRTLQKLELGLFTFYPAPKEIQLNQHEVVG